MSKGICYDTNGFSIYVQEYTCTAEDPSGKLIREASKSFFSGHSSISFYCATFLVVFLHARLSGKLRQDNKNEETNKAERWLRISFRGLRLIRPFLQFGVFMLAFFICLTRITDYKHHPTDVIAGSLIGIFYALIVLMFVIKLFDNPVVFYFRENRDGNLTDEVLTKGYNEKRTDEVAALSNKQFSLKQI